MRMLAGHSVQCLSLERQPATGFRLPKEECAMLCNVYNSNAQVLMCGSETRAPKKAGQDLVEITGMRMSGLDIDRWPAGPTDFFTFFGQSGQWL